jgi:hypothetical protein
MFENRVMRRIFDAKREEGMVDWRKLYNEDLHNFCMSTNIIGVTK